MPEMRAASGKDKDKYFRGDELPTTAQASAVTPSAPAAR